MTDWRRIDGGPGPRAESSYAKPFSATAASHVDDVQLKGRSPTSIRPTANAVPGSSELSRCSED
jgi:hypothetical protein